MRNKTVSKNKENMKVATNEKNNEEMEQGLGMTITKKRQAFKP